jgi:anti-sigma factor RsiW
MRSSSLELNEARAAYHARWEAVEAFKAQELAALTDERAGQIIRSLAAGTPWRERPDWSGLVEQQALLHSKHGS